MLLKGYDYELVNISCLPTSQDFNAIVTLGNDISEVLPYLNARISKATYHHKEKVLDFMIYGHIVTLRPFEARVTGLPSQERAEKVLKELIEMVNETWDQRDDIKPIFETVRPASPIEIFKLLPKTNCGECGVPTCLAFASSLSSGHLAPVACTPKADDVKWLDEMNRLLGMNRCKAEGE